MKQIREEDGAGEDDSDDDAMWEGWDVESDSNSDSDEEKWINVDDDDDEDLVISDSDDDSPKKDNSNTEPELLGPPRISSLATTKVCFFFVCRSLFDKFLSRS